MIAVVLVVIAIATAVAGALVATRHDDGSAPAAFTVQKGQPFSEPVYVSTQQLSLLCPDGRRVHRTPVKQPGRDDLWTVSFDQTSQQGLYSFVDVIEEVLPRRRFVVNQSEREGDLSRLSEGGFKDAFSASRWTWIRPEVAIEEMAARLHTVIELAPTLFWVLMGLLAGESFLAWRFGRRRGEVTS